MARTLQTLLTGFGAFGRVSGNPTARLVEHFQTQDVPGHELICATFPVAFHRAAEQMKALLEVGGHSGKPFDCVLMLGVASGSLHWRVEQQGINHNDALADADNFQPEAGPIIPNGPHILYATLPLEPQIAAIERLGLPVSLSASAGAYLCNQLMYTTLHLLKTSGSHTRAGFLHIPADEFTYSNNTTSAPIFPFTQHIAAVRAVLDALHTTL